MLYPLFRFFLILAGGPMILLAFLGVLSFDLSASALIFLMFYAMSTAKLFFSWFLMFCSETLLLRDGLLMHSGLMKVLILAYLSMLHALSQQSSP